MQSNFLDVQGIRGTASAAAAAAAPLAHRAGPLCRVSKAEHQAHGWQGVNLQAGVAWFGARFLKIRRTAASPYIWTASNLQAGELKPVRGPVRCQDAKTINVAYLQQPVLPAQHKVVLAPAACIGACCCVLPMLLLMLYSFCHLCVLCLHLRGLVAAPSTHSCGLICRLCSINRLHGRVNCI